ncbi:MAG TPA: AsmA-like C-terminal region-containing protein, partial [Terriglobia bacterium]|nr:AsmA-like C-terminal region-containing protein [Terriglobia bacterium]
PVAHGSFHADSLRFGNIQATSVDSQIQVFPRQAYLDNLTLNLARGMVRGKAASDFSRQNLLYSARTSFQKIDVAELLNAIPEARGKMTGTMEGNLDLNGEATHSSDPLGGMQGTGKVNVRNGRLPTLQLKKNLLFLVRIAGVGATSGDPAAFSSISADLILANQQLASHHITIASNDLNVDASGVLDLAKSNQMNYTGTALVPARQGGLTDLISQISGATFSNGNLSFPFDLRGTLDHPKFSLKTGKGILGGLSAPSPGGQQGSKPGNAIQDLFNMFQKKKSTTTPPK